MPKYARIETDTLIDTGHREVLTPAERVTQNTYLSTKSPPLKLVPIVVDTPPSLSDPATEKLSALDDVVTLTEITTGRYEVVTMSAQEQADYADLIDRSTDRTDLNPARVANLRSTATDLAGRTYANADIAALRDGVVLALRTCAKLIRAQNIDQ